MKHLSLFLLLVMGCFFARAQGKYSLSGAVVDTATHQKLTNATIAVLQAKDSILVKFTRANATGSFVLNGLPKGRYMLLVTYPEYADYVDNFELDTFSRHQDFGAIGMVLKSRLLANVIIKGTRGAIKIKGDTTEFNASSYTVQPNAKVEDLLKQLPGIQVDKDGKITAQGQTVNKVLVDGEEFFGDDPTLVTKNLRADMVDKVQLYDKKSDQATFTGVDDGVKDKTINIKLKDDKKNGYFGKVDAGIGTKGFYQGTAAFNKFAGKQKFAAYGTLANTGKTGLGWQDSNKYGATNNNVEVNDNGNIMIYSNSRDEIEGFDGRYNGQGIPTARTGGVHYDNKWNSDKQSLNTNYKIGSLGVKGTYNTLTQNNLPTGLIKSNSDQVFDKYIFRQKLDGVYQLKLDTSSNLKITFDGTVKNSNNTSNYNSVSLRGNDVLLNTNNRRLTNDADEQIFNASAFYTKKFKKVGRTLSFLISEALNNSNAKGYLNSNIAYFDSAGVQNGGQSINQFKRNNIKSNVLNTNLSYSEPLSKTLSVVANYGFLYGSSNADRQSFNQSASGAYDVLDPNFSNNYSVDQVIHQTGATFAYKKDKNALNFGTNVQAVRFKQTNEYTGDLLERNFTNWNPQATYTYRYSQQKSLRLEYRGSTRQPTIDQIQPIRDNSDPLNIQLGNPDLTPSFDNRFSINYRSFKILTNRSIYINGSYNFTSNAIVSNTSTDANGKSTFQSVNMSSHMPHGIYLYSGISSKIKALGINGGIDVNASNNVYYNMVNGALNKTQAGNYALLLNLNKWQEKKFSVYLAAGPAYSTSVASLQKQVNNNGFGFNGREYVSVYLPGKIQISSEGNYQYRAKTEAFNESFSRVSIDANISKSFFKEENLKLVLSGFDLFNQNAGFDRRATNNIIVQNSYTSIRRYFMFSIVWDFNKMGGGAPVKK